MRKIFFSLFAALLLSMLGFQVSAVVPGNFVLDPEGTEWVGELETNYPFSEDRSFRVDEYNRGMVLSPSNQLSPTGALPWLLGDGGEAAWVFIVVVLLILLVFYIYFALAYSALARRTNTKQPWLAWIPIANIYLQTRIAQMHWWPIMLLIPSVLILLKLPPLLTFILFILAIPSLITLAIFGFFWQYRIFKRVGCPEWWSLACIVGSFTGLIIFCIFLGMAAWPKKKESCGDADSAR